MRSRLPFLAAAALSACGGMPEGAAVNPQSGRYAGIGLYMAGDMWQRMAAAPRSADAEAANLRDDEIIIVTVDSRTGEVRQCGNVSGYCIAINPWAGPLGRQQALPVNLTEHRDEVERARAEQAEALTEADRNATAVTSHPEGRDP